MDDLIEALQIFRKYTNEDKPTHCEHDVLYIMDITEKEVSEKDRARLEELGFTWDDRNWISFRFGNA